MAANEVNIKLKADSKDVNSKLKNVQASVRKAGIAMSAIGAIGIVGIKKFVDAALVQDIALQKVLQSARNAGIGMEGLEEKVLSATAALQKKTNFGDEAQLEVLAQLIPTLGDMETALAALPAVMDVATLLGQDLTSTVKTMAPALAGVTDRIRGTTLEFDKSDDPMTRIAQVLEQVGGQAEAAVNPLKQLSNAMGDLDEKIGQALLPALIPFVEKAQQLVEAMQNVDEEVMRNIGTIAVWTTGIFAVLGPLALMTTALGALGAAFMFLVANPIGMIITGIGLAVITTYTAFQKWDVIMVGFKKTLNIWIELINKSAIPFINQLIKAFNAFSPKDIGLIDEIELLDTTLKGFTKRVGDLSEPMDDIVENFATTSKHVKMTNDDFEKFRAEIDNVTGDALPPLVEAQLELADIIDRVGGKTRDWNDEIQELIETGLFTEVEAINLITQKLKGEFKTAQEEAADGVLKLKDNLDDVGDSFHKVVQGMLDVVDSQRMLDEAIAKRFGRDAPLSASENQLMGALTGTTGGRIATGGAGQAGFEALGMLNQGDITAAARKLHGAGLGADFSGRAGITINVNATTTGTVDELIVKLKEALAQAGVSGEQTRSS